MPSLLGPTSSPMVSAERVLLDSTGSESGLRYPDTHLGSESQCLQLDPEVPAAEQSPESEGTFFALTKHLLSTRLA